MVVSRGVVSLGSFLSSVVAGRSRVALRVSREVRREVFGTWFVSIWEPGHDDASWLDIECVVFTGLAMCCAEIVPDV